ncbi:MAG TPA: hypothetical protein QF624_10530 [Dehalococcoidia bacterium]|nr:hypothetical protein [Dehalococcoidia bacterium]
MTALLLTACSASDDPESATATVVPPTPAATSTAGASPPVDSLRDVDFEALPLVAELIRRAGGGEIHAERVVFEDLTGDEGEEAVVIVESGGTAGDLAVAVYRLQEGRPLLALFAKTAGRVEVRLGLVVTSEGVFAADDARCCPSQLRERAYGWRDGEFVLLSDQNVDNPPR